MTERRKHRRCEYVLLDTGRSGVSDAHRTQEKQYSLPPQLHLGDFGELARGQEQVASLRFLQGSSVTLIVFVYYESLKRELKTKKIYGYRCDERLIKLT